MVAVLEMVEVLEMVVVLETSVWFGEEEVFEELCV